MPELFGRVTELYVNRRLFTGDDFTIYFDIPFDDSPADNIAKIEIYNLTDSTIHSFAGGPNVILNAGYMGDVGALLLGWSRGVASEWHDVDRVVTITAADGANAYYANTIKKTYAKGTTAKTIINDISSFTGVKIGAVTLPKNHVYKSGKTVKGKLADVLAGIAKDCGSRLYVRNGQIFFRPPKEGRVIGFTLDEDHGLIGSPTPIEKEIEVVAIKDKKKLKTKVKVKGWKVVCLLNHRITTDSILRIRSNTANGMFRVSSGRHYSTENDFLTEMEVYPA